MPKPIRINDRNLELHKAITIPKLGSKNILTNSPWEFVTLWLKREKKIDEALYFWSQSQIFIQAAMTMPVESAPLLLYYGYMNAAKTLLTAKNVTFDRYHGIKSRHKSNTSKSIILANEIIKMQTKGIAPSLASCLKEKETKKEFTLKNLLFNIPCVHRTYSITYPKENEIFIPIKNCGFLFDETNKVSYFAAEISEDYPIAKYLPLFPPTLIADPDALQAIKSTVERSINSETPTPTELESLVTMHAELRHDLHYIAGAQTLWYMKTMPSPKAQRLQRSPLTLTLLAMHRLSEFSRYYPVEFRMLLNGNENWLITEFIRMSPTQFIDELVAELTGYRVMTPNVRPAS